MEEYPAAAGWIGTAGFLQEFLRLAAAGLKAAGLKGRLEEVSRRIHSSPGGELLSEEVTKVKTQERPGYGASSGSSDGATIPLIAGGFFKGLHAYREMVEIEIRRASEHGARWWSRRLVEMCREAGLVRLDE